MMKLYIDYENVSRNGLEGIARALPAVRPRSVMRGISQKNASPSRGGVLIHLMQI